MTITRKVAIVTLAASMALASTPVLANAQSSALFGNLSSSNAAPFPAEPSYETTRDELKQILIESEEQSEAPITDEGNDIAQEFADAIISGVPEDEVSAMAYEMGGYIYVVSVPNVLLESQIDSFIRLGGSMFPYFAEISGVGVSGNDSTTYVVGFGWRP